MVSTWKFILPIFCSEFVHELTFVVALAKRVEETLDLCGLLNNENVATPLWYDRTSDQGGV